MKYTEHWRRYQLALGCMLIDIVAGHEDGVSKNSVELNTHRVIIEEGLARLDTLDAMAGKIPKTTITSSLMGYFDWNGDV